MSTTPENAMSYFAIRNVIYIEKFDGFETEIEMNDKFWQASDATFERMSCGDGHCI